MVGSICRVDAVREPLVSSQGIILRVDGPLVLVALAGRSLLLQLHGIWWFIIIIGIDPFIITRCH